MIHAFRLGPVPASTPPSYAYAVALEGGTLELRFAQDDAQGLAAVREAVKGQPLACEPALADAGQRLRLVVAPLPPQALQARALLACELASGLEHGAVPLEVVAAYVKAASAFWSSRLWELIVPGEPLHATFDLGTGQRCGQLALDAGDPSRPRLVCCDDAVQLARLRGLPGEEAIAGLGQGGGLTIELSDAPAWAAAALEEGAQLARVPRLTRRRGDGQAPAGAEDVAMGAAILAGMVAFADLGAVGDADVELEAGQLHVKARIGTTVPAPPPVEPPPAPEPESECEPAPVSVPAPEPAGETPARAPEPQTASEPVSDPVAPQAATEDDAPLSPEDLAALMKGGGAHPPPAPPPSPEPTPLLEPAPSLESAPAPEPIPSPESATAVTELDKVEFAPAASTEVPAPTISPPAVAPAPAPIARIAPVPPAEAAPAPVADGRDRGEGWLAKAWRALGASRSSEAPLDLAAARAAPPTPASKPAAKSAPKPAPPGRRAPPPTPPEAPPDPDGPFAPFARALKIAIPAEPPPAPQPDREQAAALAKQLVAGAVGGERFVSFPAVALQIIDLVHGPDADARGVAGFISRDPGLAADVLAVANSAAFRGVSEVGSVRDAVARLGLQEIGRVASAVSARALLLPARAGAGAPSTALFTRAVAVATAASAAALRLRGAHSDQVWLAGLLHDVGIALAAVAQDRLGAAGGAGVTRPVAERAVELAHAEVGAAAAKAWSLPQYLADVCGRHHDEVVPAGPEHVDLHLVRLTSALARLGEPEAGARAAREIVQSARALGYDAHAVRALAADLKAAAGRAALLVR